MRRNALITKTAEVGKSEATSDPQPLVTLRPWSYDPFWRDDLRVFAMVWARQKTKSTTCAARAFRRGAENPGLDSFFLSASLILGQELVIKEAKMWQRVLAAAPAAAAARGLKFDSTADGLTFDDLCDLVEHSRLQLRLHHDRSTVSRSMVLAANPDTAVGCTGDVYVDECGRVRRFKDVVEAVGPFITNNPQFRLIYMTTPPPDDKHDSYELLMPPQEEFPVNPSGNWYQSAAGILVHRVDAYDAYAAGVPIFDDRTGAPISPDEHRKRAFDRTGWDRNHGCKFLRGGSAALNLFLLEDAMRRGEHEGTATHVSDEIAVFPS